MKPEGQPPADYAARFRTTRWSLVLLSAQGQGPGSKAALAELCKTYWYPIYAFVRRRGAKPDDAQDLTQGFFLHLLEHQSLSHVDPLKGRFRSFLLASLQNYLSDEADHARRVKRGGNVEFIPFDTQFAECRYSLSEPDSLTADKIFDARWALSLLEEVMARLEQEYAARGKIAIFEALKPFLDPINSRLLPSYEQAANTLQVDIGAVKTLIHRLRKHYKHLLHEEVGRTVSDPKEIQDEIRALCEALITTEGRLDP
jgi:DNA-directed RNA polymerase specialized sigma24 family protein